MKSGLDAMPLFLLGDLLMRIRASYFNKILRKHFLSMGINIFLRMHNHFGKYEFSSLQYEYSAFITFQCFHLFTRRELEKTLVKTLDCTK